MRDMKIKNVYNFARSRLFEQISKSKRFIKFKSNLNQDLPYFDNEQKMFERNQLI